jgi:predicted alpha/beta-hydrolase family hydrolase
LTLELRESPAKLKLEYGMLTPASADLPTDEPITPRCGRTSVNDLVTTVCCVAAADDTDLVVEIKTESGLARLTWHGGMPSRRESANAVLLLGHGAGGGITAPDLLLVAEAARALEMAVGLVEQPYRVAGKRAPAPATRLDVAFTAVAAAAQLQVRTAGLSVAALVTGGRSSGARVACRTAAVTGAAGVLALGFPLSPPRPAGKERPTRLAELIGAGVPALVVQGERDVFGSDEQLRRELEASGTAADVLVSTAAGADHALRKGIDLTVITDWLTRFLT